MSAEPAADLEHLAPDHVFDGGDLDCGSGLVLLIRESMLRVPVGGVLEMRSREPTVADDLPPWCRMVGHEYLGSLPAGGASRHFVRRGEATATETDALEADRTRARAYTWRARVRATGLRTSRVYCRNFQFDVGQVASFEEKDAHPSAVELVLGAVGAALASGFTTECARDGVDVDDVELTVQGRLSDVLAHLGTSEGDPSFASITVTCFASTFADEARVRSAWERAVARSPLAATLAKACDVTTRLSVV